MLARFPLSLVLAAALAGRLCAASMVTPVKDSRTVAATVLSTPIYSDELEPSPDEMQDAHGRTSDEEWAANIRARRLEARIAVPLERRFCAEQGCDLTPEEARAIRAMAKVGGEACERELKPRDSSVPDEKTRREVKEACGQMEETMRDWAAGWKLHKTLHKRYGGPVILQTFGPNAVEARRRWLEEEEAAGRFHIVNPELRAAFYRAVSGYGGRSLSGEAADKAFDHPPW